jgi:hypothetical protein
MVSDAWCLCFRAWLPVWQISLFGMSEYSAMMAGIMKDVIADMDASSDPVWRGQDRHGIRRGRWPICEAVQTSSGMGKPPLQKDNDVILTISLDGVRR